jgi:hypothetical protein
MRDCCQRFPRRTLGITQQLHDLMKHCNITHGAFRLRDKYSLLPFRRGLALRWLEVNVDMMFERGPIASEDRRTPIHHPMELHA